MTKAVALRKVAPKGTALVVPTNENFLIVIARAAADPRCQPDKMRALLEMQKEIRAEEARMTFTREFNAIAAKMPSITKDCRIEIPGKSGGKAQSTPYASFENMHRVVMPILLERGFNYWTEPAVGDERSPIVMRCHLEHVSGHSRTCALPLPFETSGSKNNVQGVGSSLSYGRRYGLMNLCNIISHAPSDRDMNGDDEPKAKRKPAKATDDMGDDTEEKITGAQVKDLLTGMDECDVGPDLFLKKYNITAAHQLPAKFYDEAIRACRSYAQRVKEAAQAKSRK
jgi:hypothetical protein